MYDYLKGKMEISIIIVNYNTKELTLNCINSVFEKTKNVEFEVILVDNDSKDGSRELFEKDKRIKFVEAGENLGFGKANNLGLKYATGKYIFFLNSDTILLNNAVKIFKNFYDTHKEDLRLGGIGGQLIDKDGNLIHSGNYFPNWKEDFKAEMRDHWSHLRHKPKKSRRSVPTLKSPFPPFLIDYVTGADLFINREVIEKYGAFDPDFFMYNEETEMQYRWHGHGLENYLIDGPKVVHLEGSTMKQVKKSLTKEMIQAKSRMQYYHKTLGKMEYVFYRTVLLIHRIPYLLSSHATKNEKYNYFKLLLKK